MKPVLRVVAGREIFPQVLVYKAAVLFFSLVLLAGFVSAQTTPLQFTPIPFSDPDIVAPFRGAEDWHSSAPFQMVNNPTESGMVEAMDVYHRSSLSWDELESAQGVYTWGYLDQLFNEAIAKRQKFSFGVMTQNPGRTNSPSANGAYMSYPMYVHNLMQADLPENRDWISAEDNFWIPNYNSVHYLTRFEALLQAIANHINTSSYQGVSYRDALGYVDIRGYGSWGEWHMVFAASSVAAYPPGRRPLASSLIRIVNAHIQAFPNTPLLALMSSFDGNQYGNTMVPPEVGHYILNASNNWGKIGWRRDNWGWRDGYITNTLENNPTVYNGMRFDTAIANRWRYAPVGGEGPCGGTANGGPCAFWDIPRQVKLYHASMIGNGNFCNENQTSVQARDSMRMAWKLSGYRIILEGGSMTTQVNAGGPLSINLLWKNIGVAPVYENWNVTYELQSQSSNSVLWTANSSHRLRLFLPQQNATSVTDNFTLPANVPAGTYRLVVKIVDPTNYRRPFPLAIQGRRADGSYLLRSDIVVGAGAPVNNQAPTVNAGADQSVNFPVGSINLTGQASDPDGAIVSYAWTKVSGPAGGNLQVPTAAQTAVTGLNIGTYVFRLTVTDNSGAVASDDVQVIVSGSAPPATGGTLTVFAGNDQRLSAGTNNATLTGSVAGVADTRDVQLIVMMGESNASGIAPNTSATPYERAPRPSVKILNNSNFRFEDLDLDQNNNIDNATPWNQSHSWEIGLADAVEAGRLPNPTYLVKAAASGTRIDQWLQNGGGTWWNNMRNKLDNAIAQLRAQGRTYRISVWYSLGLNDAVQGTPADVYRSRIEQFFRDFRATYGSDIRIYMTRFHEYADAPGDGLGHPYNPTIDAIGDADPLTDVIATQGASYNPGERFVHFDYAGMKLIASRMVDAMLRYQGTGTVNSLLWSRVSGPGTVQIGSPNQFTTTVSGLENGTHVFMLEAIDNNGRVGRDSVSIIVNNNANPVANAGSDQTLALPANTVTLSGSGSDPDGTIASFAWSKVSGPAGGNIQSPNAASSSVTGLNAGTYIFRLTVTDNLGATATDDVQVTVTAAAAPPANVAPTANAGPDQAIALPANAVTLNGSGSDADGSIASYAWSKVSGPAGGTIQSPNTASTGISGLNAGTYIFRLTVTDNAGATASDDVQVVVNTSLAPSPANQAPAANAGADISITLPASAVTLSGSGSDPDGSIVSYAWSKVSGPAGGTIQSPNAASTSVTGLAAGTYVYRLTVTDNAGATASDDVQVVVGAAAPAATNQAPIANAGHDVSVTLPTNSVTLDGTASRDPDGNIVSVSWRKVQGPNSGSFNNISIASPVVSGLARGTYEFEITVTDDRGASASDRVLVTVLKINQKPVLRTRDTVTVSLPVQNTELSAVDSYDPDGTITAYSWTFRKGPKEPKILAPGNAKTVVTDLVAGTYEFALEVTDDDGDKVAKTMVVIVKQGNGRRVIPDVKVYPNPASSVVNVQVSSDLEGRTVLTFYDMNGRPVLSDVFTKTFGNSTRQVNVSRLPKGMYTILIQVDQSEKVLEKMVKH